MDLIGEAMGKSPATAAELSEPTGEPIDKDDETNDDIEIFEAAAVIARNEKALSVRPTKTLTNA